MHEVATPTSTFWEYLQRCVSQPQPPSPQPSELERADSEAQQAAALLACAHQRAADLAAALSISQVSTTARSDQQGYVFAACHTKAGVQVAVAALEKSPKSAALPAMVEVKDRAVALTALLDALSNGVEAAHRELDKKTAALSSMAAVQARAAELEKEKGQLQVLCVVSTVQ